MMIKTPFMITKKMKVHREYVTTVFNPYKVCSQQIFTFLKEKLMIFTNCLSILFLSRTLLVLTMVNTRALHTCQF